MHQQRPHTGALFIAGHKNTQKISKNKRVRPGALSCAAGRARAARLSAPVRASPTRRSRTPGLVWRKASKIFFHRAHINPFVRLSARSRACLRVFARPLCARRARLDRACARRVEARWSAVAGAAARSWRVCRARRKPHAGTRFVIASLVRHALTRSRPTNRVITHDRDRFGARSCKIASCSRARMASEPMQKPLKAHCCPGFRLLRSARAGRI